MGENAAVGSGGLPEERVGLGMAAAAVAAGAAVVLAVALSRLGPIAAAGTLPLVAGAARAYAAASGGRLHRGVAPLVMLTVSGTLLVVGLLVVVDAWHAYDVFGPDLLEVGRADFVRWALTSRAVLADYAPHLAVAVACSTLGALTAWPLVRATLADQRRRPAYGLGEPTPLGR